LEKGEEIQLKGQLADNIVEGIDTAMAFLNTYHPDLGQCLKMAVESLTAEQAKLLRAARAGGLTDRDIEEIEHRALEDILQEHDMPKNDEEGWTDLKEAVRQFVTSNTYMYFCETISPYKCEPEQT
jgi:hypothetical protein